MNITHWTPARHDPLARIFGRFFDADNNGPGYAEENGTTACESGWMPAADVATDKDGYTLRFDIPGVDREKIEVSLEDSVLKVTGSRQDVFEDKKSGEVYRHEVVTGRFTRSFRLPADVDAGSVTAVSKNGVLEVRVARDKAAGARSIPVE
jgi:HSP20 family protein